jgi:hypothetical protein
MVQWNHEARRLEFASTEEAINGCEIVFICLIFVVGSEMRVVITGGAGFLVNHLRFPRVKCCAKSRHEFVFAINFKVGPGHPATGKSQHR